MAAFLKQEDWDFSALSDQEVIPALLWEIIREQPKIDQEMPTTRAWLAGKLSERKPAMKPDKRTGKRLRFNTNFSEADTAQLRASAQFSEFIPWGEFQSFRKWTRAEYRKQYGRWIASYLRPLVRNHGFPWLRLSQEERNRLCEIIERSKRSETVRLSTAGDAAWLLKR